MEELKEQLNRIEDKLNRILLWIDASLDEVQDDDEQQLESFDDSFIYPEDDDEQTF